MRGKQVGPGYDFLSANRGRCAIRFATNSRKSRKRITIRAMEAIPTGNHREDELNKDMKVNLGATCSVDLGDVDLVGSEVDVEDVVMGSELVGAAVEELESS